MNANVLQLYDRLTIRQPYGIWEADWFAQSYRILSIHAHQVPLAFVKLAYFERERVAACMTSSCERAVVDLGLLHNVSCDWGMAVRSGGSPRHTNVLGADVRSPKVARW